MESMGIKETTDVLVAGNEIGVLMVKQLKDGFQAKEDFQAVFDKIVSDPDFRSKMAAAWENIQVVPAEIKDIDLQEGISLVMVQAMYVPKYIEAMK